MRALAAILAYLLAAVGGLAAGYYATAPHALAAAQPPAWSEPHVAHTGRGGPAQLDAVAAFLAAEEQRGDAQRTAAGL
jgi:hypothetical protein